MLVLTTLYAVFGPKTKRINLRSVNFQSTESAELYFKNMRSFSYDRIVDDKANYILYRIKSREKDTTLVGLNFLIVNNWLQDENYILAEFHPYSFIDGGLFSKNKNRCDTLMLDGSDAEAHFIFAAHFFEQLTAGSKFYYRNQQDKLVELGISEKHRKSLSKTLSDYFRLVGKLR